MTAVQALAPPPEVAFELRLAGSEVWPLVRDSWIRSHWAAGMAGKMPRGAHARGQGARIDRLLGRSSVLIAFSPAAPAEVLGYLVFELGVGPHVHWVYVKHPYRRLGVAKGLLGHAAELAPGRMQFTHKGDARGLKLLSRFAAEFNPYLVE